MGRYAPAFFSERCLIGAAKRGKERSPGKMEERQVGEEERGKAPPIRGAKENWYMEWIEGVGDIEGSHRNLNKGGRWRRCCDIWERG